MLAILWLLNKLIEQIISTLNQLGAVIALVMITNSKVLTQLS